jgi:hypothetical protein
MSVMQVAFIVVWGCIWMARRPESLAANAPLNLLIGAVLLLSAVGVVWTSATSAVIVSGDSITVRGVLMTRSIRKSSVKGYINLPVNRRPGIRLISKSSGEADLQFAKNYAFDDEWQSWISSLPNLESEEEARFTLKE